MSAIFKGDALATNGVTPVTAYTPPAGGSGSVRIKVHNPDTITHTFIVRYVGTTTKEIDRVQVDQDCDGELCGRPQSVSDGHTLTIELMEAKITTEPSFSPSSLDLEP